MSVAAARLVVGSSVNVDLLDRELLHGFLGYERVSIINVYGKACDGRWRGSGPLLLLRTDFDGFLLHVFALRCRQLSR